MVDALRDLLKRLMRIPPEPEAPFGETGSVRVFRAGRGFLRYRMLKWAPRQAGVLLGIVLFVGLPWFDPSGWVDRIPPNLFWLRYLETSIPGFVAVFEAVALTAFFVQLPLTFLMLFLDYEYRWYIITDRSLRIREGLWRVDERTMTFSNIQNLSIQQGPLQRMFGISDLEVRSAGGGGKASGDKDKESGGKNLHQAHFRGVANAAEVRDAIQKHLNAHRDSGLGDPDELSAPAPGGDEETLPAARAVLEEVRALRAALG